MACPDMETERQVLAALGEELDPPASKSAMYHRVLRMQEIVEAAEREGSSTSAEEI